jgi:myo-inositol-1(or 4)-monophosphatase
VTAADRAAEEVIRRALGARFPAHAIIGEEFGSSGDRSGLRWIIDPIDGTRSFVMGLLTWGTLIGLYDETGPRLGIMNQPFTGERFWSEADSSRYRGPDGERVLRTRECRQIEDAVLTSTHPDLFRAGEEWDRFSAIKDRSRLARYGGDCVSYCLLAMGQIDLVIEAGLQIYDIAALVPIIERAGGVVTTWTGARPDDGGRIVAAGDPRLHEIAVRMLSG